MMLTQDKQAIADAAAFLVLLAPPDQQVEALKSILDKYVDSLIEGFPKLTKEDVQTNATNYYRAIQNRIAELAMGECMGHA
jgi:hypothetical protein